MKHIVTTAMLCFGLISPLMAAEKKSTSKKPAAAEKKPAEEAKPSAKSEAEAKSLSAAQKTKLMKVINEGDDKALLALPGIGEARAAAIKKARPVADPIDLLKVDGIGEGTFSEIIAHAKAGMPESAKKDGGDDKPKAKSTKKKSS
ncbi:MAG: helix-hairpin-helix domain-containing protein [Verrucomicrobiaceae bacterium]|nr:helix-hairpin-helix domain-containing protein [Verrucomicrobiaceae bacterium]